MSQLISQRLVLEQLLACLSHQIHRMQEQLLLSQQVLPRQTLLTMEQQMGQPQLQTLPRLELRLKMLEPQTHQMQEQLLLW